jgi:hypothetical protein
LHAPGLTTHEYAPARICPSWCAVLPGHVMPDDGAHILFCEPHYWVVELSPLPARSVPQRRVVFGHYA